MKKRRRSHQRGMTLLEIMIVLAIIALVMGLVVGPLVMKHLATSRGETTKILVQKYAHEAYPSWAAASHKSCPEKLSDLHEYMNKSSSDDSWGRPLQFSCTMQGVRGLAVWSHGEDGAPDTKDDIKSWQ